MLKGNVVKIKKIIGGQYANLIKSENNLYTYITDAKEFNKNDIVNVFPDINNKNYCEAYHEVKAYIITFQSKFGCFCEIIKATTEKEMKEKFKRLYGKSKIIKFEIN